MTAKAREIWPGDPEDPRALSDAYVRIDEATRGVDTLRARFDDFVYQTVKTMVSAARGTGASNPTITLPPAATSHEGRVSEDVRLAYVRVLEDLRAALDYGVMKAALKVKPDLTDDEARRVEFVIAPSEKRFSQRIERSLGFAGTMADPLRRLMEYLQPYHGDERLQFLASASGGVKHHGLGEVRHGTTLTLTVYDSDDQRWWQSVGHWVFPLEPNSIVLARAEPRHMTVRVPGNPKKYDPLVVLPICIQHVHTIVNTLEHYVETGRLPD